MLRGVGYIILILSFLACSGNKINSSSSDELPIPLDSIKKISVISALRHQSDFESVVFDLNRQDSTVQVSRNSIVIDSGTFTLDSSVFKLFLISHSLPIKYKPVLEKGFLVELCESKSNQVLSVKAN